jgi:hypothetical protein
VTVLLTFSPPENKRDIASARDTSSVYTTDVDIVGTSNSITESAALLLAINTGVVSVIVTVSAKGALWKNRPTLYRSVANMEFGKVIIATP